MAHSEQDVEAGLRALAVAGSADKAAELLAEAGSPIPARTLTRWRGTHAERYAEIRAEVVPQIRANLASLNEDLAAAALAKQAELFARLDVEKVDHRHLPKAARDLAITSATHTDKATLLRGMPTEIRETRGAQEILEGLARRWPDLFFESKAHVDSTARELPDAEGLPAPQ